MKKSPQNIFIILFLVGKLICSHLFAQSYTDKLSNIYFEKLDFENGLSSNVVKCIIQDHFGYLWFGTADGLNRYDGKSFKIFKNDLSNIHSISGNIITGIVEDKQGCLWITTQDGGLSCYNPNAIVSKQFEQYKHDPKNPLSVPANNLNGVTIDNNGNIWVASENSGVFKLEVQTKKIRYISNKEMDTTTSGFTYGCPIIKTDYSGKVWCGSYGDAVFRLDPVSHTPKNYQDFKSAKGYKNLDGSSVYSLMPDKNIVWFAHSFGTLNKFNYVTNAFDQYQSEPENISKKRNDKWVAIEKDVRGNIWIGTLKNGCYIFNTYTNQFYNLHYDVFDPGSLSDNTVNCFYSDKTGIIWVGTNKGICKYDRFSNQVTYHYIKDEKRPGLNNINIYDFYENDDGSFWLATDAGLFVRDKNALDFNCKYSSFHNKPLIIYKILKYGGRVYLITNSNNFVYDRKNNLLTQIPFLLLSPDDSNGNEYSYQNSIKTAVVADTPDIVFYYKASDLSRRFDSWERFGDKTIKWIRDTMKCPVLWVGSIGWGIYQYLPSKNYCYTAVHYQGRGVGNYLSNNLVHSIIKDKDGTIWIATNGGGLNKINDKSPYGWWLNFSHYLNDPSNAYSLSSNSISDMCLDKNGIFWITTYDGVLNRFDPNAKDKKYFTHITGADNLSRQSMFSILCDAKNNLWIAAASAILKYNISTNKFTAWKLKDQLPYDQYPGKKYIGKDGTIYFGGDKFYISFNPDFLHTSSSVPPVVITSFKIFENPADDFLLNKEIKLKYDQNFFTFEFASLNFSNSAENKFAYKLDGIDKNWIQKGNINRAPYTNIPPGTYTFHIKASNNNDVWNEQGISLTITILPAWYQTWLFKIGLAFTIAVLIFFATRYYFRQKLKLQQEQLKLQQEKIAKEKAVETVRVKISQDIHDEIGSGLTKISLMSQRLKMNAENKKNIDASLLDKITESSKEVVGNLGEIIWTVNPKYDNLQSLLSYIRNYASNFCENTPIQCTIDFEDDVPAISISPELKHNLFLVIKECLNNVLKHAEATELFIHFHYEQQTYCFEITDNGKGIGDLKGREFGNGLINMKNRMEAIKGKFEIESQKNGGTKITLLGQLIEV